VTLGEALTEIPIDRLRCQFFQVVEGSCTMNDRELWAGDMMYLEDGYRLTISGAEGELLYFDLPRYSAA
jgi:hypothetical protein